jgi:hypothetical protein
MPGYFYTASLRPAMDMVLVIYFLTIRSSYLNDCEEPATEGSFDTVQFLSTENGAWRIKTYAIDEDVHVWSLGANRSDIADLARQNTEKYYGDILSEGYVLETSQGIDGLRRELVQRGLSDHLEISKAGFLFWAPGGTSYRSKSTPKQ